MCRICLWFLVRAYAQYYRMGKVPIADSRWWWKMDTKFQGSDSRSSRKCSASIMIFHSAFDYTRHTKIHNYICPQWNWNAEPAMHHTSHLCGFNLDMHKCVGGWTNYLSANFTEYLHATSILKFCSTDFSCCETKCHHLLKFYHFSRKFIRAWSHFMISCSCWCTTNVNKMIVFKHISQSHSVCFCICICTHISRS